MILIHCLLALILTALIGGFFFCGHELTLLRTGKDKTPLGELVKRSRHLKRLRRRKL